MRYCTIMRGNWEGQYIRLEFISAKNLHVPSERIPAGFYVSTNVDLRTCWKSAVRVFSSDKSVVWRDTVTLSQESPTLSMEIRASYEVDRMLGNEEVIGQLETLWDELLDHGDESFELSFPPVCGVNPSLKLKVAVVHACDNQDDTLFDSLVDREISRDADAGHARFAEYMSSMKVSLVNAAYRDLTNLMWACLRAYTQNDLQDIDAIRSLFRELRPESPYLRTCVDSAVYYAIPHFNNIPIDSSDDDILLRRVVLELCPLYHEHRPIALATLARALTERFDQHGSIGDLEEGIRLHREALSLCPEGHSDRGRILNNLAYSLRSRFNHQGKSDDLDEVISMHEEALHLSPVGHKFRDCLSGNLGCALLTRFKERGDVDDINRAVSLNREALMFLPGWHPHRVNNLATALATRYENLRVIEDLNEAIDLFRESLRLRQLDHHKTLSNLSLALCSSFMRTQKNADIEEAIRLCQESLMALSPLHPDRHHSYVALREAYKARYCMQHQPADLLLAVENFRLASQYPTEGFPRRIMGAYNWTVVAEEYCDGSALEAYSTFFELLDAHLATRSSTTSRREAAIVFHRCRSLPVDAASCAIRSNDLRRAVELVEQGRAQQWSLASRFKTPVEDIESAHPHLAHEFSELSKHVSNAAQYSATITDRAAAEVEETKYRRIMTRWEAVVAEIRNLQGFSRFLLPPLYEDLQAAARHGPVIILIASKYSCSAIVVPTSGEPRLVRFRRITLAHLEKLKEDFATAIRHTARMRPEEPRKKLRVLLRIVWDEIILLIVKVLQDDLNLQPRSRIWLCPTAAFTSIPLHAANPFRKNTLTGKESCLEDLYICSYTPTLSALIRARLAMKTRATPSFAAIGQSQPGAGQGDVLPAVNSELELVHTLIPPNITFTNLSKDKATQAGALNALQRNTWVHLACHGKQDLEQPYNSCFAMRDKPVTLLDIMENNSPQAEFAFLSACHTAIGDEETPDEAIHLAAGLQFSGFKSVIGTLWGVNDALAKHVVEAFYKKMFEDLKDGVIDCTKAAWALNRATQAVITKVPLEQRTVFIHIGV